MAFDPDDYLSTPPATATAPAPASGFDPSEYLATQPAQASVFATPSDLADYAKHHSLATGDNGSGAWGDDTTSSIPQVALPRDTITDADHGRPVHLMGANGNVVTAYVTDKMPATYNIKNGASIDLNPAAQAAIGHPGGIAPVRWRFADSPAASGGDAMGGGASPAPAPFDPDAYLATDPSTLTPVSSVPANARNVTPPVTSTVQAVPDNRPDAPAPDAPNLLERGAGDVLAGLDSAGQIIATVPQFVQNTRAQLSDDAAEQDRLRASAQEFADQNRLVQQGMSHNGGLDTRIAQGLGTTADAMLPDGVGLATIFAGASDNARNEAEDKARAAGASPEDIAAAGDAASNHAALTTAETLPAYMVAGAGAGKLASALTPETAGAIRAYLTQAAAGTAGNVAASAGVRALQGEPVAPTAEGFFGADLPFALAHAGGEVGARGKEAMEALRTAAQPGGIDFTADETTDPAPSEPPVAVPPETSQSPGLAPESAESQTRTIPQTEESTLPRTESTTSSISFTPDPVRGQADVSPGDVITTREGVEHTVTGVDDAGNVQAVVPGASPDDVGREVQLSPEAVRGALAGGGSVTPAEQVPIAFTPEDSNDVLTHRRSTPTIPPGNVILFHGHEEDAGDAADNSHYGKHVWTLKSDLPEVPDEVVKFAADYYGIPEEEAEKEVRPTRIVDSGRAWDDKQFVSDLWQQMEAGNIKESPGFKTPDGAVVLDRDAVQMDYRHENGPEVVPASNETAKTNIENEQEPPVLPVPSGNVPETAPNVSETPVSTPAKEPTGTANTVIDEARTARGLAPIDPVARQDFGTAWDKGGDVLKNDPQAGVRLVSELNAKPRALTDEENALLLRRQVETQSAFDRASDAVNNATPETLPAAKAALDQATQDIYDVHTAARAAGAETGRGLNARKMLSTERYELSSMLNRKRAANDGKPLTDDQTAEVKAAHAKIAALEEKQAAHDAMVQELRDQLAKKYPKQTLREAAKAAKPAKRSLTDFLNDQAEAARQRRMERKGRFNTGADPTELADLAIIGASHIANGVKRFGEWSTAMVKDAGEAIKPHLLHIFAEAKRVHEETLQELDPERKTPREIALKRIGTVLKDQVDVITHRLATGERKPDGTPLEYTPELKKLQQQRDDLNIALRAITKRPDLSLEQRISMATKATERSIKELNRRIGEKDFVPTKRVPVETPELKAMREQRDTLRQTYQEMKDAAGPPKRTPEEIKLDNIKKSLTKRTAELQERLKNEDFAKKTRQVTQLDQEALNLKANHQRAKDAFDMAVERDRLANRPVAQRAADTFVKAERAIKLTGISTLGKITGATMARVGLTPLEEGVGSVTRHLPFVRGVAARAPRFGGGLDLEAERAAAGGVLRGVREIPSILKSGQSDLDALYGKRNLSPHSPILDAPGALHGAIAAPAARAEFDRATVQRTKAYARMGLDTSNPLVKARIASESYQDSQRAVFGQQNFASDAYRSLVRSLETSKRAPNLGFAAAKALDFLFPVVKKPLNIIGEGIAGYGTGSVTSPIRILYAALHGGIHNLEPDVADGILRNLNKGLVGNAMMALGYMAYKQIGGQYQPGEKRSPKDVQEGQVKLPDWMGGATIPKAWFESPGFMAMNVGATIHRISEQFDHRTGGLKGIGEASKMAVLGILRDVPFVSTSSLVSGLLDPNKSDSTVGRLAASTVVPAGVAQAAKYFDQRDKNGEPVKRTPQGIVQSVEAGIPGLRQNVPLATGTKEDRAANLPLMTGPQRAVYQQQQMQQKLQQARMRRMRTALTN